jgi:hypothetical protein
MTSSRLHTHYAAGVGRCGKRATSCSTLWRWIVPSWPGIGLALDQEKHHRKMSYEEEIFVHFLQELLQLIAASCPASGRGSGEEC